MSSLKRSLSRQSKHRRFRKMDAIGFEVKLILQDTGQLDGDGDIIRLEYQNDPKYLAQLLNGVDTSKEPYKNRRRTILRLFDKFYSISKDWTMFLRNNKISNAEEDFELVNVIEISPEGMEFLYEFVKSPPEGARYQSISVQRLLISIEDQYDAWKKGKDDGKGESSKDGVEDSE